MMHTPNMFEYIHLDKFDIWSLYNCLKEYYPLGMKFPPEGYSPNYKTYPGLKKYADALEPIHNQETYKRVWTSFEQSLAETTGKEVVGTTMGLGPCFSCYLILEQQTIGDLTRRKEVHVFVSLLGPYFTIVGKDRSEINPIDYSILNTQINFIESTNFILVSPQFEFKEVFDLALKTVEGSFNNYRFIPFAFYKEVIPGLQVPYNDNLFPGKIFNGLFNDTIDFNAFVLGDDYFSAEEWIKEGYTEPEGGWTSYPPMMT